MIVTGVILAAGHGKRMLSRLPKVLHPLAGRPMILYSIQAVAEATGRKPVVVVGHGADAVRATAGDRADFALQEQQLGTAHALAVTRPLLEGRTDLVLLATADMPLLTADTFARLIAEQKANDGPVTMLSLIAEDPHGFGRVVRGPGGEVLAIVEEAQATPEQLAIRELNASVYCFRADWLWPALERVEKSPKGEYYLTDLVGIAVGDGYTVRALVAEDPQEAIGINTRAYLAEAEEIMRNRINQRWMDAGVSLVDPRTTYIEPDVTIGKDTIIYPNTHLRGETRVGSDCRIGPNAVLNGALVGDGCTVLSAVVEDSVLEEGARVEPFEVLRGVRRTAAQPQTDELSVQ